MKLTKKTIPGILICVAIAAISTFLAKLKIGGFSLEVIGAPVFAILFGMIITLIVPKFAVNDLFQSGIKFTSKKILQLAVIILGFSLDLSTIARVGTQSLPVIVCTISISLITAFVLMKLLKIDSKVATLIGVGSSICGGSAIAATAPVIDADDDEVAQAISVIFLFNVLAALIFPYLGHGIGLGSEGFAIFAGTAVNDTSSVTAAASTAEGIYGADRILTTAVTVKLTRTLAIIPITLVLALYRMHAAKKTALLNGSAAENEGGATNTFEFKKIFPWFILLFIGASIITTLVGAPILTSLVGIEPSPEFRIFYSVRFVGAMKWLAKFFIAMAMCAIGLNTDLVKLIKKGGKPILMGFICWVAITVTSLAIQMLTGIYYSNL